MVRCAAIAGVLLVVCVAAAEAVDFPVLPDHLHPGLAATRPDLVRSFALLSLERAAVVARIATFETACGSGVPVGSAREAQCRKDLPVVSLQAEEHDRKSTEFLDSYNAAMDAFEVKTMNALAGRLGWDAQERTRLGVALQALLTADAVSGTSPQILQAWTDILARGPNSVFAREAAQGLGPGFPGAGEQTENEDCAVFALANAAGIPYGVAAARATKLIAEGEWREAADRANPEAIIAKEGLHGFEIAMLTEAFGQAQVVLSAGFAETVKGGRSVTIRVIPEDGDMDSLHQVVLSRTFQHGGQPWFEMMDSNQGPVRRLYLSAIELNTMLSGKGVAYQPEDHTVPMLLR